MLEVRGLEKSFFQEAERVEVLRNATFSIAAGQSAALLGESGSGKSTLLNLIAGLDEAQGGEIIVNGQTTRHFGDSQWNELRRNQLGLVFQQYHLVPTLSVSDNLKLQARLGSNYDENNFQHLVSELGLGQLLARLPHQLSGGQQQRVAIGRALMHKPRLVLADEPTGNLDEDTSRQVMKLFVEMVKLSGSALLMVTHSEEMSDFLERRLLLNHGEVIERG